MAAVLACGDGAALSHRSAAEHLKLLPVRDGAPHITVPGTGGRKKRRGIHIHRSPYLTGAVTTTRDGIRVTTAARTIVDLRRTAPAREVRRAIRQAEIAGYRLDGIETDGTRSDLERDFLRLCRRHRLPMPEVNARVGPYRVDFLWRDRKLIVETDGYRYHRGRQAFRDDRERDVELGLRGFRVHRFADETIAEDPASVAATLRSLLSID
jgi:very-short-patch-repair endonuclease